MEELFSIIGKMYVELSNNQKFIEILQKTIKEKDDEILKLKNGSEDDRAGD